MMYSDESLPESRFELVNLPLNRPPERTPSQSVGLVLTIAGQLPGLPRIQPLGHVLLAHLQ